MLGLCGPTSATACLPPAKGQCALWGATSAERRIEVEHIIPRSKGGSNDESNLQAVCDECNRGKSNTDDTDFRASNLPPSPS